MYSISKLFRITFGPHFRSTYEKIRLACVSFGPQMWSCLMNPPFFLSTHHVTDTRFGSRNIGFPI